MTELDFLLQLVLEHKLQKVTQLAIKERIREIQAKPQYVIPQSNPITQPVYQPTIIPAKVIVGGQVQAGSMAAKIAAFEAEKSANGGKTPPPVVGPVDPANAMAPLIPANAPIAQTPQAIQAMQARQEAISIAVSGREEKGRTSPRKF